MTPLNRSYQDLIAAVHNYSAQFRHPNLAPLRVSRRYDLFPEVSEVDDLEGKWPQMYPGGAHAGVYAFLCRESSLLYVGKASMGRTLVDRLSDYCGYQSGRASPCALRNAWEDPRPRFIVTIAVPDESKFEAAALEEYLIVALSPPANKNGIVRCA